MEHSDLRVLAILVTWFGVYAPWVNADRLTAIVAEIKSPRVRAFWSALAAWQGKERRFARLAKTYAGPRVNVQPGRTEFQVKRHGEDPRFMGSAIRVASNVLRDRPGDVLDPKELATRNRVFRCRVQMGPSYRYGSFATAWHVRKDFWVVHPEQRG